MWKCDALEVLECWHAMYSCIMLNWGVVCICSHVGLYIRIL